MRFLAPGLVVSSILFASRLALAQAVEVAGTVDAVTVYRGQALVSRVIDLEGAAGLREIVVTELPEFLLPASLYAESGAGVEVRSVSYRVRPLPEDARESVRKLETEIRAARDKLEASKGRQRYMEWHRQYLDKLENFLAATAQVENGRGVLNAETIAKMTELVTRQRLEQTEHGQELAVEMRNELEALQLLERELEHTTARSSRTAREAVVLVNQTVPHSTLRLNYLVDRATWTPSYNLRLDGSGGAAADSGRVGVEYQASIQQMSGEDWKDVAITLSTATPALVASAPSLDPLAIALAAPGTAQSQELVQLQSKGYADAKKELATKQRDAENVRNFNGNNPVVARQTLEVGQAPIQQGFNPSAVSFVTSETDKGLNDVASQCQLLDVTTSGNVDNRQVRSASLVPLDESVSVTYSIAGRTSLPSRDDQQLLQIARLAAPSTLAKVATPLLTSYVYDQATITNASDLVLLAGPSASYRNGEFVGRGSVPTVSVGETFTAGFGIDSSLRASRELLERTESIQGGNKVVEFAYRLSIENFGKAPAEIRLLDRVPHPRGTDIRVTMVSTGNADQPLSKDAAYERGEKKNGLLRWDLTVPPGVTGTNAYALEYRFRLEFDKQMSVAEAAAK